MQLSSPWKYLGWKIASHAIQPQILKTVPHVRTLNDLQKLLGTINWLRPLLGITTQELHPLFKLLKGDPDLTSKRQLTPEAQQCLDSVITSVQNRYSHRVCLSLPVHLIIISNFYQPYSLLCQWDTSKKDPLIILEWVFLPHTFSKTITSRVEMFAMLIQRGRHRLQILRALDPECIYVPATKKDLDWMLAQSLPFQTAMADYTGQLSTHPPKHQLLHNLADIPIATNTLLSHVPIPNAVTVFTDGSGKTHQAVVLWRATATQWQSDVHVVDGSPQVVELAAVARAFQIFSDQKLNIITDSLYVTGIIQRIEGSFLKEVNNPVLFVQLKRVLHYVSHRTLPYFIMHIRSHTTLPGPLTEGNRKADQATVAFATPQLFEQARLSHQFFHQNRRALQKQFQLTVDQARNIILTCPDCQAIAPLPQTGTNPRGTAPLQLWQTDVTHVPEFGRLKYVHVTIDTHSSYIFATAHTGERSRDARKHWLSAYAAMGIPHTIKTDNGPAYTSKATQTFLQEWGVRHITGIPHSPTGQAIIERTHQTLKSVLNKQKRGNTGDTPQERLCKALFVLNFLNRDHTNTTRVDRHFGGSPVLKERPMVNIRNMATGHWEGPLPLITWGRGYACVSTRTGPTWVPARYVRPHLKAENNTQP